MDSKLSREEVLHVAELAKIRIKEEEMEKYQINLGKIFADIKEIDHVSGYDDEIIISPFHEDARLREDVKVEEVPTSDILKNVPHHSGNYIEVPVVINE